MRFLQASGPPGALYCPRVPAGGPPVPGRRREVQVKGGANRLVWGLGVWFCVAAGAADAAAARTIGVFVALADNASQGIVPVPAAIGNGDDPERNLYWGAAEGLRGVFDRSPDWELTDQNDQPAGEGLLRKRTYRHRSSGTLLKAGAYRGSAIRQCIQDFEAAVRAGAFDLVVFIGHNGLMDSEVAVPAPSPRPRTSPDCIVLCCKSEAYFAPRLAALGGRPVLLTTQLMYPGAFILHAAADAWIRGAAPGEIRECAGAAYASNQKLSRKAGLGVFAVWPPAAVTPAGGGGTTTEPSPSRHE